jgi:hypothetical protein
MNISAPFFLILSITFEPGCGSARAIHPSVLLNDSPVFGFREYALVIIVNSHADRRKYFRSETQNMERNPFGQLFSSGVLGICWVLKKGLDDAIF